MTRNLNSISFTVLLLVLVMASTGFLKSEAAVGTCPPVPACITPKFYEECGPPLYTGTHADCCKCCIDKYGAPPVCGVAVEGTPKHCHCYSN